MKVVLDTNIILASAYHKSRYNIIFEYLLKNKYHIFLTTNIYFEYKEKLQQIFNVTVATYIIKTLKTLPNVHKINTFYDMNIITNDPDNNKFVDCAFAANVDYIVTNDKHFNVLKEIDFPSIDVININQFIKILTANIKQ